MATNYSSSLVVLPFQMLAENSVANAFESDATVVHSNVDSKNIFESYVNYIKTLPIKSDKIVDSSKYHDYISNYISPYSEKENSSFLKIFSFQIANLKGLDISGQEIQFKNQFQDSHTKLFLGDSNLEIKFDKIIIVLNEIAELAYFIFEIDYIIENDNALKFISEIDFFRYYKPKELMDKKQKHISKYLIRTIKEKKDKEKNIITETQNIALYEIIRNYFNYIFRSANFIYDKPVMLHLFSQAGKDVLSNDELINTCFKVLRIPPLVKGKEAPNKPLETKLEDLHSVKPKLAQLHYPDQSIVFCTMNEGAIVIDTSSNVDTNSLVNKYFPAFILALNQREVMIKTAKDVSQIPYKNLNAEDSITLKKLSELRKTLNLIQLKQVFYNISIYNETELFFTELQKKFSIDVLLNDNKGSIDAIHSLLESERISKEEEANKLLEEAQKKRDNNLGLILSLVGLFGAASAVIDLYNFYHNPDSIAFWWLPYFVIFSFGAYLVWFYKRKK
jgi:hypothetical protein